MTTKSVGWGNGPVVLQP